MRFVDEGFQRSFDLRRTRSAIVVVPKRFFRPRDRGGDLFQKANALGAGVEPVGAADGQHTAPSAAKQSNADPIATDEGRAVVCDSVSRCAQIEAGMSLFDEPVEHAPQMFARLGNWLSWRLRPEIGSQIVERREKTEIAALGTRRGTGPLKNFDDAERFDIDRQRRQEEQESGWISRQRFTRQRCQWRHGPAGSLRHDVLQQPGVALGVGPIGGQRHALEIHLTVELDLSGGVSNPNRSADGRQPAHCAIQ